MKCASCGVENPDDIKFCMKCGTELVANSGVAPATTPSSPRVEMMAQGWLSNMFETPGTTILTLGVAMVLIAVLVGALRHYVAGIALFGISVVLIYFAVQLRSLETRPRVTGATLTEVREREIVKVKCRYCGGLNPDGAKNCGSCGALL